MSQIHPSLKIYPSGFLGSNKVPQTDPIDMVTVAKMLITPGMITPKGHYTANALVSELWLNASGNSPDSKTFEFTERVIKCAYEAFGVKNIDEWVFNNIDGPEFSDTHYRWINETLEYVYFSKPRQSGLSQHTWARVLTVGDNNYTGPRLSDTVKRAFLIKDFEPRFINGLTRDTSLASFLNQWVQCENGLYDLIGALHVMFGARSR